MARPLSDSPMLFDLPVRPDFRMERAAAREGIWPVCGTDEAGRGPLAGPVVAAAVILDPKRIPKGLDDSKRMTHAEREAVFGEILKKALAVSVASVSAHSIDCSDIRKASLEAMCRAVKSLHIEPMLVLADGRDIPPGLTCGGKAVVKGDQRSQSIAAASIIAKVTRDRMMTRTASIHAGYGFDLHMGYATVRHRTAIEVHGPLTRLHRLSFAPFRLDPVEVVEAAE